MLSYIKSIGKYVTMEKKMKPVLIVLFSPVLLNMSGIAQSADEQRNSSAIAMRATMDN